MIRLAIRVARAGDIDLMVGTEGAREPGFVAQLLAEDTIVVAAHAGHPVFDKPRPALKDLAQWRWVLQTPGAPTRDWLDQTFDRHNLPRPVVQVESTMLLMLPTLIGETGLLSFISRLHLQAGRAGAGLREVELPALTMRRRLVATWRDSGYVSPAAEVAARRRGRAAVRDGHQPTDAQPPLEFGRPLRQLP